MYRILIKPDGPNPIVGGMRYRVVGCWKQYAKTGPDIHSRNGFMSMSLPTSKCLGTIINPRKELKELLGAKQIG